MTSDGKSYINFSHSMTTCLSIPYAYALGGVNGIGNATSLSQGLVSWECSNLNLENVFHSALH